MEVGEKEDGVIVKGCGQGGEVEGDTGGFEPKGVFLSPLVYPHQAEHGLHEDMIVEGIFEVHKITPEPRSDLTRAKLPEAHAGPQRSWIIGEWRGEEDPVEEKRSQESTHPEKNQQQEHLTGTQQQDRSDKEQGKEAFKALIQDGNDIAAGGSKSSLDET